MQYDMLHYQKNKRAKERTERAFHMKFMNFDEFIHTLQTSTGARAALEASPGETILSEERRSALLETQNASSTSALEDTFALKVPEGALATQKPRIYDHGTTNENILFLDKLGEGGMGIVHLAQQEELKRQVAVKSVRFPHRTSKSQELFMQEARMTSILEHPNIVPVYALGTHADGFPMLVMKRVAGVSWGTVLKGEAELPSSLQVSQVPLISHIHILIKVQAVLNPVACFLQANIVMNMRNTPTTTLTITLTLALALFSR